MKTELSASIAAKVLDQLPGMVMLLDRQNDVVWADPGCAKVLGCDGGDWAGKSVLQWIHPFSRTQFEAALLSLDSSAPESVPVFFEEISMLLSNGDSKVLSFRLAPWAGEEASVLVSISADDEPLRRPLKKSGPQADFKYAIEQAGGLQEDMLLLARISVVKHFAAGLAHEMNQPLAAILSNAQAAIRFLQNGTAEPGEVQEILSDIVQEDQRASKVVSRLRALFQRGPEEGPEEVTAINLNRLIEETFEIVRGEAVRRKLKTELELEEPALMIHGDVIQVQQALLNLVANAMEAMADTDQESRLLRLSTKREKDGSICLIVQDTGRGLGGQRLDDLTQPFYTTQQDGLGLGLKVTQEIMEKHHGALEVLEQEERGASFCLSFPPVTSPAGAGI